MEELGTALRKSYFLGCVSAITASSAVTSVAISMVQMRIWYAFDTTSS